MRYYCDFLQVWPRPANGGSLAGPRALFDRLDCVKGDAGHPGEFGLSQAPGFARGSDAETNAVGIAGRHAGLRS